MRNSLREKVLLKASVYHIVAFVNNECLGRGNYVVVRAKPVISNKRFIHSPAEKKSYNFAIKRWPGQKIRLWYLSAGLLIKR